MRMKALPTAALLALCVSGAHAADLLQVWQAARAHDPQMAVAEAARAAGATQREQARALWRPNLGFSGGVGQRTADTDIRGAQFSAPGMGTFERRVVRHLGAQRHGHAMGRERTPALDPR